MSWMDSWSRPSKSSTFPPPIYLTTVGPIPYCHTCGRVMSSKKEIKPAQSTPVKYCSSRCRGNKPGPVDRKIEDAFAALLNDDPRSFTTKYPGEEVRIENSGKVKKGKGDMRTIVWCSEVEELVFGSRYDAGKTAGRRKNRAPRGVPNEKVWKSVDMEDDADFSPRPMEPEDHEEEESYSDDSVHELEDIEVDVDADHVYFGAGKKRPEQSKANVNGSVGGEKGWAEKIEETPEMRQKRLDGQRRAEERELVRKAARRGVAFGFVTQKREAPTSRKGKRGGKRKEVDEEGQDESSKVEKRLCEAVITKAVIVVEPSFAKGDWGVRWRE
ncbi:hypothetical protein WAI453_003048 [Rhynchosporium graminicola]|uniref:Related to chitinase n=1 Tax=Rhynchosporium graminicola TaxID=2792576 RepID=A0A1E1LJC7_9HELO|nr:related to chitinase [Rhynchosporium commune]